MSTGNRPAGRALIAVYFCLSVLTSEKSAGGSSITQNHRLARSPYIRPPSPAATPLIRPDLGGTDNFLSIFTLTNGHPSNAARGHYSVVKIGHKPLYKRPPIPRKNENALTQPRSHLKQREGSHWCSEMRGRTKNKEREPLGVERDMSHLEQREGAQREYVASRTKRVCRKALKVVRLYQEHIFLFLKVFFIPASGALPHQRPPLLCGHFSHSPRVAA